MTIKCFEDLEIWQEAELNDLLERTQRLKFKIGNFMEYLKNSPLTGSKYKKG